MRSKFLALGAGLLFALSAHLAAAQSGNVEVNDVWARATPGGAQTGAVYATIISTAGDKLTAVATPVAQKAELHSMTMDNGVMKMREVGDIDLPAGKPVSLKPGGYHIMLTGLAQPLKEGQKIALTLTFQKAGARQVTATVEKVGSMGPSNKAGGMDTMHH